MKWRNSSFFNISKVAVMFVFNTFRCILKIKNSKFDVSKKWTPSKKQNQLYQEKMPILNVRIWILEDVEHWILHVGCHPSQDAHPSHLAPILGAGFSILKILHLHTPMQCTNHQNTATFTFLHWGFAFFLNVAEFTFFHCTSVKKMKFSDIMTMFFKK